jgi:hypothetical protein
MSYRSQPSSIVGQYCQIHMEMDLGQKELALKAVNIGNGPEKRGEGYQIHFYGTQSIKGSRQNIGEPGSNWFQSVLWKFPDYEDRLCKFPGCHNLSVANPKLPKQEKPWGDGPCPAKDSWLKTKFKYWGFTTANIEKYFATRETKSQREEQLLMSHEPPSQEILMEAVRILLRNKKLLQWLSDQYWDE